MKFIVDTQLPKSLSDFLISKGYDAVHTLELPLQNRTGDNAINLIAKQQARIVISKDNDFLETYMVKNEPEKLVLIKTGNISNGDLLKIFEMQLDKICSYIDSSNLVVIYKTGIVAH